MPPRTRPDRSGFSVTLGEAARVTSPSSQRSPRSAMEESNRPMTQKTAASVYESFLADKRYVLFLTPTELFIWEQLLLRLKVNDDDEIRAPIPKTNEGIVSKWQPDDAIKEEDFETIVELFIEARIIEVVGSSGNGHETYKFLRQPGMYHVIPIDTRTELNTSPSWVSLIRCIQAQTATFFKQHPFRKKFKAWVSESHAPITGGSADVKLFNYRPEGSGGWGVIINNPDVGDMRSFAQRRDRPNITPYLVAIPGFEAHTFKTLDGSKTIEVSPPPPDEPATVAEVVQLPTTFAEPELETEPEVELEPETEPEVESLSPPSPPNTSPRSVQVESLNDDELREKMSTLQVDITELEHALSEAKSQHAACKAELKLRLSKRIQSVAKREEALRTEHARLKLELEGL